MSEHTDISALIRETVEELSSRIGPRPAGSEGQRRSEQYLAATLRACGFDVEIQRTDCPRWELKSLSLRLDGRPLAAVANPHSPACHVTAPLVRVETVDGLRQARLNGRIVVLAGELAAAPFFPKNFDFFRDEQQDAIISTVESKQPLAVIAVSGRDIPVPLIEDADFPLPSITVSRQVGAELARGGVAELAIDAHRQAGHAAHVIARGPEGPAHRLVICAHYDTKYGTPGAVDNAAGVAALLALARLLQTSRGPAGVELVAFGGEDSWYPAEVAYIDQAGVNAAAVAAVINIDGVGVRGHRDTVTFLGCPDDLVEAVRQVNARYPEVAQVPPWYAGDHSLFWRKGIPAIALTSAACLDPENPVLHTAHDTPDQVDPQRIAGTVQFIRQVADMIRPA